ncbi:hypothetical protein [Actinoplanes sp. L3-i22]|uniref:hypothetical protein n=1 Tax=Actinoplanes sp. L3-i22 TaxID=2836373 RepID=UPI001C858F9D|nr:hypothetical protein [Actinoplanes sp. L3-i22]
MSGSSASSSPSASSPSSELPQRRKGGRDRIYRQPPAGVEAPAGGWFGDGEDPDADPPPFTPASPASSASYEALAASGGSAFGSPAGGSSGSPVASSRESAYEPPASSPPEYGPASPGGPGRASFGFSSGPISGNRPIGGRDDSGAFVRDDSGAFPVPEPDSGGLPIVRRNPVETAPAAPTSPAAAAWAAPEAAVPNPASGGFPSWEGTTWADTLDVPRSMPGQQPPAPAVRTAPPRRRHSRMVTAGMTVLGTIAVLVIAVTGVVYYSGPDSRINQMLNLGGGNPTADPRLVTAPINGRTRAAFEMLAASDRIRVSVADIGDDLFRISTPDGSPLRPSPELTGDNVRLQLTRDGAGADGEVDVVLAARVRWTLRFSGYAAEREVSLGDGRVDGIELVGGTRRAVLALSKATATVPVKITGGIEELTLRAPAGSPIRVKVGGGATTVNAGTRTLKDVAPGSTLTPKDWKTSGRYDVETASKITLLSVEAG